MTNTQTKPMPISLRRATTLVENTFNQIYLAGEEFQKFQQQDLTKENNADLPHELTNMIDPIYQESLMLSYSAKMAQDKINKLSLKARQSERLKNNINMIPKGDQERRFGGTRDSFCLEIKLTN